MKDQTVSIFTSASTFLTAFCSKEEKKKGSNKSRVWDCHLFASLGVCKLPRTHLAWVHLSTKNSQHVSPRNNFSWISSSCPISLIAAVVYFGFCWVFFEEYFGEESIIYAVHIPLWCLALWGLSHLAPFGCRINNKVLMQRAGGRVQLLVLNCWWAVQNLSCISLSDKSNLLLNVCCLSTAIDCFKNLPWHQMIYL